MFFPIGHKPNFYTVLKALFVARCVRAVKSVISLSQALSEVTRERFSSSAAAGVAVRDSLSGDHSAVEPHVPIPNTEVKRCSPDDSASIGRAKVGHRQYLPPLASSPLARGGFVYPFSHELSHEIPQTHAHSLGDRPRQIGTPSSKVLSSSASVASPSSLAATTEVGGREKLTV